MNSLLIDYFLQLIKDLNLLEAFSPLKKTRLEPEITEDGTYELYVAFKKYAAYMLVIIITLIINLLQA